MVAKRCHHSSVKFSSIEVWSRESSAYLLLFKREYEEEMAKSTWEGSISSVILYTVKWTAPLRRRNRQP
jgi:hypothetical protein